MWDLSFKYKVYFVSLGGRYIILPSLTLSGWDLLIHLSSQYIFYDDIGIVDPWFTFFCSQLKMVDATFDPRFIQCNKAVSLLGLMQIDRH